MRVRTGLDLFLDQRLDLVAGKRVTVIAHSASVDSRIRNIVDLFRHHPEIELVSVMGPQHGIYGETQDNMVEWEGYRDPDSKLPFHSLYGETRRPTRSMLSETDVLVFDLQDVGARYYTFIHTLALVLEAAGESGKEVVVLDRPNPIGGVQLEGPVLDPAFRSFVGLYPLPIRHGMTMGEIAGYLNSEFALGCSLQVVPMQGWKREMYFENTGLPWVMPSPNMPSVETALAYPGLCLLEGTNVSEGRGTTRPFELSGAPWISAPALVAELECARLPGVHFRPLYFIPTFHKWAGERVGGIQIHVTDRARFKPFLTGLVLVRLYRELSDGRFEWKPPPYEYEMEKLPFDILCGTDRLRLQLEDGTAPQDAARQWQPQLKAFEEVRQRYLLY